MSDTQFAKYAEGILKVLDGILTRLDAIIELNTPDTISILPINGTIESRPDNSELGEQLPPVSNNENEAQF